ncbi:MAG: hypothetical protein M1150_04465 [Patescibacteria group bacterium]|nr:hypothetical protein [Patescibacteria group bacterium]
MLTLLKPLQVREELLKRGIRIFSAQEFTRLFQTSSTKTKYFLEEQTKQDLFFRLKKGLYALKTNPPTEEEIANSLYKPSYISFEYALAYYNILPEMTYQVTSATTKPTRIFTIDSKVFNFYKIKKEAFTGYFLFELEHKSILMAEPEKALVDYFYFVSLGKKPYNERLNTNNLKKGKILKYARLFGRKSLTKLVKELI